MWVNARGKFCVVFSDIFVQKRTPHEFLIVIKYVHILYPLIMHRRRNGDATVDVMYGDCGEMDYFCYRETWREGGNYVPVNDRGQYVALETRKTIQEWIHR